MHTIINGIPIWDHKTLFFYFSLLFLHQRNVSSGGWQVSIYIFMWCLFYCCGIKPKSKVRSFRYFAYCVMLQQKNDEHHIVVIINMHYALMYSRIITTLSFPLHTASEGGRREQVEVNEKGIIGIPITSSSALSS